MAKNSITDYDNIAANNTDIQSVDIDEGCAPSGINNAIRELMADLADVNDGTVPLASPDINGGTIDGVTIGGTTAGAGTFTTVTADDLVVDESLRVGDSPTSIAGLLSVRSDANSHAISIYEPVGANENWQFGVNVDGDLGFYNSGSTTASVTFDDSGNVGIGTSSPLSKLHLYDTSSDVLLRMTTSTSNDTAIFMGDTSDGAAGRILYDSSDNLRLYTNSSERMRIDSSGNVGIGTSSPARKLHLQDTGSTALQIQSTGDADAFVRLVTNTNGAYIGIDDSLNLVKINNGNALSSLSHLAIDSSGNVLVGTTDALPVTNNDASGIALRADGNAQFSRSGAATARFNRGTSDGEIVSFGKDGTTVGSIGVGSGDLYIDGLANHSGIRFQASSLIPRYNGAVSDNTVDLGTSGNRFDDVYATNGTIQTSDQNEKQQIASLTDAEMTAAKAISKLFKTFKWNDKVEAKGDAARRHAGVIAQDVQQAMSNAGLDAGDYAFFISTTWWETQTEVPAVEADEENGIEAQDAYTRTDTYDTAEEAPEGATERTRLGIRYPELLSFIGAATEQRLASIESRLDTLENA